MRKIIPLAIGNTWKYKITHWDEMGKYDCTTWDSATVAETTRIGETTYFQIEGYIPHLRCIHQKHLSTVDSSNYTEYICKDCFTEKTNGNPIGNAASLLPVYILRAPVQVGNDWKVAEWDTSDHSCFENARIVNIDATVQSRTGKFKHAIQVVHYSYMENTMYFIVPGIGIVLQHWSTTVGSTTAELYAWDLK